MWVGTTRTESSSPGPRESMIDCLWSSRPDRDPRLAAGAGQRRCMPHHLPSSLILVWQRRPAKRQGAGRRPHRYRQTDASPGPDAAPGLYLWNARSLLCRVRLIDMPAPRRTIAQSSSSHEGALRAPRPSAATGEGCRARSGWATILQACRWWDPETEQCLPPGRSQTRWRSWRCAERWRPLSPLELVSSAAATPPRAPPRPAAIPEGLLTATGAGGPT